MPGYKLDPIACFRGWRKYVVTRGWVDEREGNSVGDHGETASGACTGPGMAAACLPIANDFKS